jgi:nicotinate-nucleotide--dimethylbenzimidazole phosphoribosyltransferase
MHNLFLSKKEIWYGQWKVHTSKSVSFFKFKEEAMNLLTNTLNQIEDLDEKTMSLTKERIDNLVKPVGSLGKLEEIAIQISGITKELYPVLKDKKIIVMSADNGVCIEGIAAAPQVVTEIQTYNIAKGVSGVGPLSALSGAEIIVVDIGINAEMNYEKIINRKIRYGTGNIAHEAAMTREEAIRGIEVGIEITNEVIKNGASLIGTGEMGIGNTTPSTAMLSVLGNYHPEEITGVGANLPLDRLSHKTAVIEKAISYNQPDKNDVLDVLSKVGSLDIAGMTGIILSCAANRVPCVIDGYISTIAAIIACKLNPKTKKYMIASHASMEKGAKAASDYLGLQPMLDMNMRLGEGSGAALAFNIIEAALLMNKNMITFEEAGIGAV